MAGKPSKTVQQLINQFNIDTSNIIKNAGKPVVYDRSKVKIDPKQSNWIYSYKPTKSTAKNKNTKANLTSIKNNIAHAGKSGLDKLLYALDIIDRPREVVAGVVDKLTDGKDQNWGDYKKGIADSWMGRKETSASDIMENLGWKNKKGWNWNNPLDMAHDLVAFTGDVALDPLTYATFGAGGALKATAKAAAPFIKQAEAQAVRHRRRSPRLPRECNPRLKKRAVPWRQQQFRRGKQPAANLLFWNDKL